MEYPRDAEYFVINDSVHSVNNFLTHKNAGITTSNFTDPRCKDVWDAIISMSNRGETYFSEIDILLEIRKTTERDQSEFLMELFDFHTTRNVLHYRKLLLDGAARLKRNHR